MRYWLYRFIMQTAHRFNWHYAPPIYPEGDTQLWCKWCGVRQTIKRAGDGLVTMPDGTMMPYHQVSSGSSIFTGLDRHEAVK